MSKAFKVFGPKGLMDRDEYQRMQRDPSSEIKSPRAKAYRVFSANGTMTSDEYQKHYYEHE